MRGLSYTEEHTDQQRPNNDEYTKPVVGLIESEVPSSTAYNYESQQKKEDDNNNIMQDDIKPLWKMGRMLVESLSKGKMRRLKIFGTSLEDLPLNNHGLPKIAHRLCSFIEHNGLSDDNLFTPCKKQLKHLERYKMSFERAGDADLENSPNAKIAAALLKIWLRELPQPLILPSVVEKLMTIYKAYNIKDVYDIQTEVSKVLSHLPKLNLGVLYIVIRLLYRYTIVKCYSESSDAPRIPEIFTSILIRENTAEHTEIISMIINNFHDMFDHRLIDKLFRLHFKPDRKYHLQKIAKDLILSVDSSESKKAASVFNDKLIRSKSEEKLSPDKNVDIMLTPNNHNLDGTKPKIQDFSKHQYQPIKPIDKVTDYDASSQMILSDEKESHRNYLNQMGENDAEQDVAVDKYEALEVQIAPPPINFMDSNEQEKIRASERFSPQYNISKKTPSRKRKKLSQTSKQLQNFTNAFTTSINTIKMNNLNSFITEQDNSTCTPNVEYENNDDLSSPSSSSSSSSPSSSTSSSTLSSPLKSPLSPERAHHVRSNSEPLTSLHNWSLAHHPPDDALHKDRSLPARNSLSRRSFSEFSTSSRLHNPSLIELQILSISKQIHWLKKKMKRFEEDYYDKHGQFPSFCQKMAVPEYKQMSVSLILFKNNLKQLKKESIEHILRKSYLDKENMESIRITTTSKEDVVKQVEKMLHERRQTDKRPERVVDMSFEQLEDEKLIIQKIVHDIECNFGEKESRAEISFQWIYNHQRLIKRLLARSASSMKLKESSSDLATIKENETMEFGNSVSDNAASTLAERTTSPTACQDCCVMSDMYEDTEQLDNIHSLSCNELWAEYKLTKERKRKLKNQLQMFELETTSKPDNDLQHCIKSVRHHYKRVKAKLKLLDALLVKMK